MKHAQEGQTFEFDVIVIGSGLAGLHYTRKLLQTHPTATIALICKSTQEEGNSRYAQGGIAAVLDPSPHALEQHIQDTLNAGAGLCHEDNVRAIIQQGPYILSELKAYRIPFEKNDKGDYALGQEGGHRERRILHCGDETGATLIHSILSTMPHASQRLSGFEYHTAINLITRYTPHDLSQRGEVLGAYVLDEKTHNIHTFLSKCVILATGGSGKTYRYTTNPMIATGDGVAMAYRAGARVGNMEFYQFHPTLLHHDKLTHFLISEAVRGEGAVLRQPDTLDRFMHEYDPIHQELATRDLVSRAIFNQIEQNKFGFVYLDITHQSKSFLKKRFPNIYTTLHGVGIDMSQDMIPVVPAAHYQCGGVLTNLHGETDLKRLYAIGEVGFTGLHGANRLASNSLLEAIVMASNAVQRSQRDINTPWAKPTPHIPMWNSPTEINPRRATQLNAHWQSIRGEMTSYAGIIRTEAGLLDLLELIKKRKQMIEDYYWNHLITRDFIELRNIILTAELIVRSALARRESRGGHYREDFPLSSPKTKESILAMTTLEIITA